MRSELTFDPALALASSSSERREMVQRAERERAESRRRELDSQSSPEILPEERIRIWESLHALQLPRTEEHPLVAVIARQTQLSVLDIRDEQTRRRARREVVVSG